MKRRLKYPLIVEGKYDKATLSNLVEGEILLTDGFHIYKNKEMLSLLRQLAQNGPVAVLTDSDRAGFSIRGHLAGAIPPERLIQVYIPEIYGKERRKTTPSAEGKLGVEGMPPEILLSILEQAGLLEDSEVPCPAAITKADLYHGECDPIDDPIRYGVFCSFFGKLYIGPIVSAQQFVPQLDDPQMTAEGITRGMVQYLRGLAKIVILAGSLQELIIQWETLLSLEVTILGTWLHVLCYIFYIYFTLSGYSDMARGTGAVFGLDLPENFHHPLQSYSVADFFGRFNISANRFVRKYVYQALGAEDNGPLSTSVNILLITMLMGLWYGINLNYLAWGAFLGLFIIFEVLYIERHVEKIPPYLCRMYTFIAILISFCWYCGDSLAASAASLRVMLGRGGAAAANQSCLYLLQTHWLLLAASVFLCSGAVSPLLARFTRRWPTAAHTATLVWNLILLATSLAFLL